MTAIPSFLRRPVSAKPARLEPERLTMAPAIKTLLEIPKCRINLSPQAAEATRSTTPASALVGDGLRSARGRQTKSWLAPLRAKQNARGMKPSF